MKISEVMSREVRTAAPEETIRTAARTMQEIDAGVLPVGENDRLVGMITDRDIALRGIGEGKGPEARVREVMTKEVKYCFEDQDLDEVASNMADQKLRRMPVVDRDKRLVGLFSLGDAAGQPAVQRALSGVSQAGQPHSH